MDFFHLFLAFLLSQKVHFTHSALDVSLYLQTILKNHTAHACEGDTLFIECPFRTSVTILSAFYGRLVPNQHLCPSSNSNKTAVEDTECSSPVAIEKVFSECHDRRSCHFPVISPVFGQDPCPQTSKYLLVSFKCRPKHHRTRLVCENERLRLICKNQTVLMIYSATFGHLLHGNPYCPQETLSHMDMALRKVSRRCHSKANCSLLADTHTFGDPCFPGTRKHLRVSFTCVPQYLLENVGRESVDPFMISDYTHGGWYTGPTYRPKNVLLTNSLEMIEKILGFPERVALYFVSGISAGLVFLLCIFGLRSTLMRDFKDLVSELNQTHRHHKELMEADDISDTSSFHPLTQSHQTDTYSPSTLTIEMVEYNMEPRTELPNGDMWPHPNSSPYSIHKIKTHNIS
ncbi:protein eva-1 homolog C isoform X2 [Antennarius striatus]|uniref:protein eva-1 homolog C isoform X2 n=1 Tax=Antennarius striatus TaxID=241820 RepID=UPI0035B138E1